MDGIFHISGAKDGEFIETSRASAQGALDLAAQYETLGYRALIVTPEGGYLSYADFQAYCRQQ